MIPRYSLAPMAALFTDEARYRAWLEVEILATEGQAEAGVVPPAAVTAIRDRADFTVAEIEAREQITEHDVAAFVDVVQAHIGEPEAAWLHYGLTSSDVVDTALSLTLVRATDLLLESVDALVKVLVAQAHKYSGVPMVGRTHGIHAEPTTFGAKVSLWALAAQRDRERVAVANHQQRQFGAPQPFFNNHRVTGGAECFPR